LKQEQDITQLLQAAAVGDQAASDALFTAVYQELRVIADAHRRRWSGNDTLNTTALINEAYVKLANKALADYRDRTHFFATASKAMRQILISYAKRVSTAKRGANAIRVTLSGMAQENERTFEDLIVIDKVLEKLEQENVRHCRLFECRVFGGMTIEETATALSVSPATVKRDWTMLSAWVFREMQEERAH
jgi:RNA polymerase sigma factor (TIGR02999 family)